MRWRSSRRSFRRAREISRGAGASPEAPAHARLKPRGGRSSVGRAPGCGPGGRRSESGRSPRVESFRVDRDAVIRWLEALNARDLDRILSRVAPNIEFHPLKLRASRAAYVGYDGIRQWFEEVQDRRHEIREHSLEELS